jgi:hypothetical protein
VGYTLNALTMAAFSDELEKMAGLANIVRQVAKPALSGVRRLGRGTQGWFEGGGEAVNRVLSPVRGLKKGWQEMSPVTGIERRAIQAGHTSLPHAVEALKGNPEKLKELLEGGGEHLLQETSAPGTGRVRALAENLSRSGWTGAGNRTKYLPVGAKSIQTGFAASIIPSVVHAPKATPTGEGGALETGLGELGGTLGMVSGSGIGIVPSTALMIGGNYAGSRLGRILDRVRSGAGLKSAITAPTPTQAAERLEAIQKYYGNAPNPPRVG